MRLRKANRTLTKLLVMPQHDDEDWQSQVRCALEEVSDIWEVIK